MWVKAYELNGVTILEYEEGSELQNRRDATELIGLAWEHRARCVAIPVELLTKDFFRLSTRVAGEMLQTFLTYELRVAVIGDVSEYVSRSCAFRDFVYESNRGKHIWFLSDIAELRARLAGVDK